MERNLPVSVIIHIRDSRTKTVIASAPWESVPVEIQGEIAKAVREKTWWEKAFSLEVIAEEVPDTPGPAPTPTPTPVPPPTGGDYNPRYWYGAVNSVASMSPDEQRQYVQACAAARIGILLEYLGWKKGEWWKKRAALRAAMQPFFDEARRLRVPVHIYVINTNSAEVGALPIEVLTGFADDVMALADPSKDRILPCNEASSETSVAKRSQLTAYVFGKWTGRLVSYDNDDNPNHERVVVCETHRQRHDDFTKVNASKPTFFVSDNRPMIKWLSNSDDDHALRFDQGRVRQWKGELPNSAAGQGYYGWMHEHADMVTIATLG